MNETSELVQKRKETQEEILKIRGKTAPASVIEFLSKVIPKKIAKENPLYWVGVILTLNFLIIIPPLLIANFVNELNVVRSIWTSWSMANQVVIAGLVASNFAAKYFLGVIGNILVPKITESDDLLKLSKWICYRTLTVDSRG